ncbi:MAG: DUF805 domain-containing protein [Lentisphaeria bacterium]|nr:DUF805 domain-containing protein [Lentisphaeria bacterium]
MNKITDFVNSYKQTLSSSFSFSGRATRKEFWIFTIINFIIFFILGIICAALSAIISNDAPYFLLVLLSVILIVPSISLTVRRLHDVGLSGFWVWYLNPTGLPIIFVVYLLGLDKSVDNIIERIRNIGSTWLGWILTIIFWAVGAPAAIFLLYLYAGKKEANEYGPSPYED